MHAPKVSGPYVTASGNPCTFAEEGIATVIDPTVAQINHYLTKSRAEYEAKKRRGNANRALSAEDKFTRYDDDLFTHHDRNEVREERITRFIPAINQMISHWIDLGVDSR